MPFFLYLLGLAVFAQGTSEFMLSGLLPDIAADLQISLSAAGSLTSAFAVGMIVGAPLMAILSLRWSRRGALLTFLVTFLLVHIVGAVTTDYGVLLATRVIAALANAGFLAVALTTATAAVPPNAKGRATSVLLGGTTMACIAGVPAGALLGELWGWRSAFWAVALVSVPAVVAIVWSVPAGGGRDSAAGEPSARGELRALRSPRLVVTLLLGALVNGATFCTFTYLAPLVTDVAGIGTSWVPAVLALFGLGSFVGVGVGGRLADTRPVPLLVAGGVALLIGWAVLALTAGSPAATVVLVLVQGTLSFAVGSTLIAQALYAATGAPTLAGGFATAALNVGAAIGPWWGGAALGMGFGYRGPVWVSVLMVALALATGGVAGAVPRRRTAKINDRQPVVTTRLPGSP
ncbi:Cmx/CmrA family chloramphenicol efflux MFS transporter [Streptomyces inhibens]|uniref:Cmx/CmrA family chloramphenicol efflux MFS transporter n=1 Tax=Streptomyces inhibens TaxID=2293571 RepID=UPI001EE73F07|nr:Cmx/CmrA family chloramphenicol efflux MFS transporter [Streptomyces inhibens]UKY53788.1 MFS transporter [Streptomyces inhibens]